MRELKDYFCNYEQTQKILSLGFAGAEHLKHITPNNETLYNLSESCFGAISRAQALDFFREKGYETIIEKYEAGYGYAIRFKVKKDTIIYLQGDFTPYEESESMLIDRLIEMELDKEVQDGN